MNNLEMELAEYGALAPRMVVPCDEPQPDMLPLLHAPNCPRCHGTGKVAPLMYNEGWMREYEVRAYIHGGIPTVPLGLLLDTANAMGIAPNLQPFGRQWGASGVAGGLFAPTSTLAVIRAITAALDAKGGTP